MLKKGMLFLILVIFGLACAPSAAAVEKAIQKPRQPRLPRPHPHHPLKSPRRSPAQPALLPYSPPSRQPLPRCQRSKTSPACYPIPKISLRDINLAVWEAFRLSGTPG